MYAAFCLFIIEPLNQPITIDESAEAALVGASLSGAVRLTALAVTAREKGRPQVPGSVIVRPHREPEPDLNHYFLIASSFVPRNPALSHFRIRHSDLQGSNIIVSRSPHSNWQVVGLLDWQHTSILPSFLLASVPDRLQNYDDPISQSMTPPSLPEKFDKSERRGSTVAASSITTTSRTRRNATYAVFTNRMGMLGYRLFHHTSNPWEGESLTLKVALIQATEKWETLTGRGAPCPVVFDAEDVRETMKLDEEQRETDAAL